MKRGIDVDKTKKDKINIACQISEYKNLIVIYPDKLNFLNTTLQEMKKPTKIEEKIEDKESKLIAIMKELLAQMRNDFNLKLEKIDKIEKELNEINNKISKS